MGFMANDNSGILVSHRPKQESARCVGRDGDEVLEGLCEREKEEVERKEKPIRINPRQIKKKLREERCKKRRNSNRLTSGTMVSVALRSAAISITIASRG